MIGIQNSQARCKKMHRACYNMYILVIRQYDIVVLTKIYYKISAPLNNSEFLEVPYIMM